MAHISGFTVHDWDDYTLEAEDGFMDSSKYYTPENESDKRKQLQTQHSQLRDYINNTLVAKINNLDDEDASIEGNYALKSQSGKTLTVSYSAANSNRITIVLTAADGTTVLDTKSVDLGLGKMLSGISYDSDNKRLVISYVQNGTNATEYVSIASILTGYATENWVLSKNYETVADSNLIRARVETLETFKNTTVPNTNETKSDANTHKNNSDIHVTAAKKTYWDAKQQPLVAGAYIVLESMPDGTVKISAANGTIAVDYQNATNKPRINNVELVGNKSFADLGIPIVVDSNGYICMEEE